MRPLHSFPVALAGVRLIQYANLSGDPYQRTQEALEHDPSCIIAHCLRGLLAALGQSDPAAVAACLAAAERELEAAAARLGAEAVADLPPGEGIVRREGERERVYAATLRAWSAGRWREVRPGCACVFIKCGFRLLTPRSLWTYSSCAPPASMQPSVVHVLCILSR